jgi:hypothetical protein
MNPPGGKCVWQAASSWRVSVRSGRPVRHRTRNWDCVRESSALPVCARPAVAPVPIPAASDRVRTGILPGRCRRRSARRLSNGFQHTITNSPPTSATGSTVVSTFLLTDDSTSINNESAKSLQTTSYRVATLPAAHWDAQLSGLLIHHATPRSSGVDFRGAITFSSVIQRAW